jgi:hypothetical protein
MHRLCTIIALNYLPQAIVLLESTRDVYPEIEFYVLITDATHREIPNLPNAHVLLPEDLDILPDWLLEMRSYYDTVEFATSLKPFLLSTLLVDNVRTVTFLDPDILLISELTDGFEGAENLGIALTPIRLTPSDVNAENFSELSFLQYGIFNLGFIAVGHNGKPMLKWWSERLRWYATRYPLDHVFTDQKWINFVPALFPCEILRNPGYNFTQWNIDERPLHWVGDVIYAGDSPLVFIHFSQMSGALAKGKKTKYWESALDDSPVSMNSLAIVSKFTDNYSDRLVALGRKFSVDPSVITSKSNIQLLGFHQRQKMISASIKASRSGIEYRNANTPIKTYGGLSSRMIRSMERSSILNGFLWGWNLDFPKLVNKFRKLLTFRSRN